MGKQIDPHLCGSKPAGNCDFASNSVCVAKDRLVCVHDRVIMLSYRIGDKRKMLYNCGGGDTMDQLYTLTFHSGSEKKIITTNDPEEVLKEVEQSESKWCRVDDHTIINLDNVTSVTFHEQQAPARPRSVRNAGH
jgi:hypothetical protein